MLYDHHRTNTQGYTLWGSTVLSIISHCGSAHHGENSHIGSSRFHLDVTHVTSTRFVPLPVLVPVGISAQNKSLSRTQFQGFGNSNCTMCQEEIELEISLKNTNNYQGFVDSGPGPWQNCEGRTFPLGAPDSQCPFFFPVPPLYLCPFSVSGPFSSTIRTGNYLIFLLVCII